jgi:toxin ParE1/3/4
MKYKITYSKDAGEDLFEIVSWYKYNGGRNVAKNIHSKIKSKISKLKDMPGIGKPARIQSTKPRVVFLE